MLDYPVNSRGGIPNIWPKMPTLFVIAVSTRIGNRLNLSVEAGKPVTTNQPATSTERDTVNSWT